jgi:hypothetical protein
VFAERKHGRHDKNDKENDRENAHNQKNTNIKNTPHQKIATRRAHTGEGNHTADGGAGKRMRKIERAGGRQAGRKEEERWRERTQQRNKTGDTRREGCNAIVS